jgi:ABC-2 type transport system permease protein
MHERLRAFGWVWWARQLELARQPEILFWSFGFPVLLTVALGAAFRERPPEPLPVAVVEAQGAEALAARLEASSALRVVRAAPAEALALLRRGRVVLAATAGSPPELRLDPRNAEARLARFEVEAALRAEDAGAAELVRLQTVRERGSRYVDFLVPGLIGMNLMQGSLFGVGFLLVDLRMRKLLKRYVATPMVRGDFLLALICSRLVMALVGVLVLLGAAVWLFGLRPQSPGAAAVVVLFGAAAFSGLGLMLGSRATRMETISGMINLFSLPMLMFSGVFFSYERFPEVLYPLIRALPLTALIDALRAVLNEGSGLLEQAGRLGILGLWAAVTFTLGLRRFRWI